MSSISIRRFFATILLVFSGVVSAYAEPKIGVLLKGKNSFWEAVEKGAIDGGAKLGVTVIVKSPISETDVAVQVQLLNAIAAQNPDAIVIAPDSKDALAAPLAALAAKGVKIVAIDSPVGSVASVFVGTDHRAAGEAAGKFVASLIQDADEVGIFRHNQGGGATEQRELGAIQKIREAHPTVVLHGDIYSSTEKGMEPERAALILSKYPNLKVVLASGTPGTMAMLGKLKTATGPTPKFVGFGFNLNPDVAAALESGLMSGWIAQLPHDVGFQGVQAALKLINGQTVPPIVTTDFIVITKDNLKDPKVQALLTL